MNAESVHFQSWALRALREMDGLMVEPATDGGIDLSIQGGPQQHFIFQYKSVLSSEMAKRLAERKQSAAPGTLLLLGVPRLAANGRKLLRDAGMSWIERDTGICFILGPGILVDREVSVPAHTKLPVDAVPQLRDRAGLIAEFLLNFSSSNRHIRVDSTADKAGVSPSVVSRVFRRLTNLNILEEQDKGPARRWNLKDRGALLDLWAQEERTAKQTTSLYVWATNVRSLYDKLVRLNDLGHQWGIAGLAAANLYVPTLTNYPDPIVRLDASVPAKRIAEVLGGEVVEKGSNLQVWQSIGNLALHEVGYDTESPKLPWSLTLPRVTQARAYIETASAGGRAPEVAERLRERIMSNHG